MPVIFGGWHPSLLPEQTLREDFVDIVVRHQGDHTLVEILRRPRPRQPLDLISGWFKRNGRIHSSPPRPALPLSAVALGLFRHGGFRSLRARHRPSCRMPPSIGCPLRLQLLYGYGVLQPARFNPQEVAPVINGKLPPWFQQAASSPKVALGVDCFLVDTRRALAIARGFLASKQSFQWTFQASTDLLCRLSDEQVCLLGASGVSHIGFGTESASPEILRLMNKRHQQIDDMFETARKCGQAGIRTTFNLILGYPGEEEIHRSQTLRVMGEIASRYDNVNFSPNLFTPYPGIPIWPDLRARGLQEPASLEEWSVMGLGQMELPWLAGETGRTIQRGMSYFLLDNQINKTRLKSRSLALQIAFSLLRKPLHWRLRHHFFRWPLELWVSAAQQWLVMRRSLLTGEPLGQSMNGVR